MHEENPIIKAIAANIKIARKAAGLTQEQLAVACGVQKGTVYQWETCKREVSAEFLLRVANALSRSWLWFYQDHEPVSEATPAPQAMPNELRHAVQAAATAAAEAAYRDYWASQRRTLAVGEQNLTDCESFEQISGFQWKNAYGALDSLVSGNLALAGS